MTLHGDVTGPDPERWTRFWVSVQARGITQALAAGTSFEEANLTGSLQVTSNLLGAALRHPEWARAWLDILATASGVTAAELEGANREVVRMLPVEILHEEACDGA